MESKEDQTVKRVIKILTLKYGRTRVEKIEEIMDNWSKFKDDHYEDYSKLLLGMKELNQRRKELKMSEDEWVAEWMLRIVKRRKKLNKFVYQYL